MAPILTFTDHQASAGPDASNFIGFVPEPNNGRGTIGLLWQCLTTIFLCTYTAQHFDIPPKPLNLKRTMGRDTLWVLGTLFVPEVLLGKSYLDFLAAKRLRDRWNVLPVDREVGLKQAFFVVCNGLSVQYLHSDGRSYKTLESEATDFWALKPVPLGKRLDLEELDLKQRHILILLDHLSEAHLSKDVIDAASHIDILSKLVTCTQAGWTGIQIIARLVERLDVSLLEIITAGFILTAIVSYVNWLKKPYNIGQTKEVRVPLILKLGDGQTVNQEVVQQLEGFSDEECSEENAQTSDAVLEQSSEEKSHESDGNSEHNSEEHPVARLKRRSDELRTSLSSRKLESHFDFQAVDNLDKQNSGKLNITRKKSNLKQGLHDTKQKAISSYKGWKHALHDIWDLLEDSDNQQYLRLPLVGKLGPGVQLIVIVGLVLFFWFGFTALHLSAWNYNFPTSTEKWMWRGSAITFGAAPFAILLCALLGGLADPEQEEGPMPTGTWRSIRKILLWIFIMLFSLLILLYVCARWFIIIESFISFRRAPAGIYQKVDWTSYWAHIGN